MAEREPEPLTLDAYDDQAEAGSGVEPAVEEPQLRRAALDAHHDQADASPGVEPAMEQFQLGRVGGNEGSLKHALLSGCGHRGRVVIHD